MPQLFFETKRPKGSQPVLLHGNEGLHYQGLQSGKLTMLVGLGLSAALGVCSCHCPSCHLERSAAQTMQSTLKN